MKAANRQRTIPLFFALLAVAAMWFPTVAWAETSEGLMSHVPIEAPVIVGIDVPLVKDAHLFQEGISFLKTAAKKESLLAFALSKKAFDPEKDVESAVLAFQTAPTNPQAPPPPTMAVVSGKFDAKRVRSAVEAQFGKITVSKAGKFEIYSTGGVDFSFVTPTTLVITERAFAPSTWEASRTKAKAASSSKEIKDLLKMTDTSKGIWFAVATKSVPTPAGTPPMDGAGLSIDLASGLALDINSQFAKAEDATKALEQFEEVKKTKDDALIEMLGLTPLVTNLSAKINNDRTLAMKSSMTEWEVKVMLQRMKSMNEAPPPVAPAGKPGATTPPTTPTQPGKGANADFN